ncbi:MAG: energy transducer TonB [Marinobacter sp.]|uniref:energy transducer TonB n=1 Tax=Marinobacter sp. TaxID=50741 RepID=UPI00299E35CC|nr:energy transducer TonB [Marinobacter sp.]MDX1635560.1 energy transducer TonB [Marinobacter sp.]
MAVQVSDFDRFSFTLFLALALHAVLVLGITFAPELPPATAETMEITLSQYDDQEAPEEADFLAQTSQQGSGTEAERQEMTTPVPAEVTGDADSQAQPSTPTRTEAAERPQQEVVETTSRSEPVARQKPVEKPPEMDAPVAEQKSLMERSLEIARLEARFDDQRQAYAKKPRVLRVTAVSTLASANAWYVQNWIDKVTRVGNLNYPAEARREGIYGTLRVLVVLKADGSLKEVAILESSGSSVLDDAAIRIIRLAAPFSAFPEEMREQADQLEIIRTWSFQRRGLSSG